jgi:hypothetical protein
MAGTRPAMTVCCGRVLQYAARGAGAAEAGNRTIPLPRRAAPQYPSGSATTGVHRVFFTTDKNDCVEAW